MIKLGLETMQESLPVVDDSFSSWKLGGERWEKIERNELWILKLRRVGGRKKICGRKELEIFFRLSLTIIYYHSYS